MFQRKIEERKLIQNLIRKKRRQSLRHFEAAEKEKEFIMSDQESEEEEEGIKNGMDVNVHLKGFGFTFIDNQPREILFLCINDIYMGYYYETTDQNQIKELAEENETETKTIMKIEIGNF